jgi:hypothetical protein
MILGGHNNGGNLEILIYQVNEKKLRMEIGVLG